MRRPTASVPVRVECRAEGRADEEPRAVHLPEGRLRVVAVLDRWHDAGRTRDQEVRRIFKVLLEDDREIFLEQVVGTGAWSWRAPIGIRLD